MIKLLNFPNQYYLSSEQKTVLIESLKEIIEQIENNEIRNIFCATSAPAAREYSFLCLADSTTLALAAAQATKLYSER